MKASKELSQALAVSRQLLDKSRATTAKTKRLLEDRLMEESHKDHGQIEAAEEALARPGSSIAFG
jgi:hypothetical protein